GKSLMDMPDVETHEGWMPLISINGLDEVYLEKFERATEADVTAFIIAHETNPGSILNVAQAIRHNLRSSRDVFPKQMYEKISTLYRYINQQITLGIDSGNRRLFLDDVGRMSLEISGVVHSMLRHDQAYKFMRMACYLERADMTTRVLDVPSSLSPANRNGEALSAFEVRHWSGALYSVSAMQMYRRHVRQPVSAPGVLNFLLNDEQLPSAFRFCLVRLERCLNSFSNHQPVSTVVEQQLHSLQEADIQMLSADAVARHRFLDDLQLGLINTHNAIANTYFPPASEPA
ncbi:MAG: alpha-E domain-containing protein, partial [Pseudomonadota bacterium]